MCRCQTCEAEVIVETGETPPGWALVRDRAPRLWLCPEHAADGASVLNRLIDGLWAQRDALGVFRARVETLVQWAEGEHHKAFEDGEMLRAIELYARYSRLADGTVIR